MAAPHVSGAAALLAPAAPGLDARQQVKSALMSTAGPAWGDTARTRRRRCCSRARACQRRRAPTPAALHRPALALVRLPERQPRRARKPLLVSLSDAGDGAGAWTVAIAAQSRRAGATITPGIGRDVPPGGTATCRSSRPRRGSPRGDNTGFVVFTRGADGSADPVLLHASSCRRSAARRGSRSSATRSTTRARGPTSSTSTASRPCRSARARTTPAPGCTRTARSTSTPSTSNTQIANAGAAITAAGIGALHRAVVPRLAERERRPGLRGDARQRERPHLRVPVRQPGGRARVPARGPVLRRGRLARRPVHGSDA